MKNGITKILLFCLIIFSAYKVNAQTTLSPGDIAIIAWDANASSTSTNHQLQWVTLVPLTNGTIIKFTEAGFNTAGSTSNAGTWRTGHIAVWQNTGSTIPAGTIISNNYINVVGSSTTSIGSISVIPATCVCGSLSSDPLIWQQMAGIILFIKGARLQVVQLLILLITDLLQDFQVQQYICFTTKEQLVTQLGFLQLAC